MPRKTTKFPGELEPARASPSSNVRTLRAANDNARARRTVVLLEFDRIPLRAAEIAVIDGLMQVCPPAANDNCPAA